MNHQPIPPRPETAKPLARDPAQAPAGTRPMAATSAATGLYNPGQPILETKDIIAMVVATIMALGPLSAYALGYGL